MEQNKYFKFFIVVLAVAVVVPTVVSAAWWNPFSWGVWNRIFHFQQIEQRQPVVCTQEAKQCPDGSYVGRQGPKCEFAPCPEVNAGKCETDKDCPIIQCIKAPCPESKCINNTCQMGLFWDAIYPFYSGVNWETVGPKKMTVPVSDISLEGYGVKGQGKINQNQDARKFFNYYDSKLQAAGWIVENNFAADGIKGSQVGYQKDGNYIVLSYNITPGKITSGTNEPLQWTCPCQVQYDIFAGTALIKNPPIVGGDKDVHGCIGSAGYTWCEAKQKCLRSWEEKCEVASAIETACASSGGKVATQDCYCASTKDFYNSCLIGGCTCTPDPQYKRQIKVCDCGEGKCWNGEKCATRGY